MYLKKSIYLKFKAIILLTATFLLICHSSFSQDNTIQQQKLKLSPEEKLFLQKHGPVRIAAVDNLNPYSFKQDDIFQGLAYDYFDLVAKKAGFKTTTVESSWDLLNQQIRDNKIDIVNTIIPTQSRKHVFNFSKPFHTITLAIISRTGNSYNSLSQLKNKSVAFINNSSFIELLKKYNLNNKIIHCENHLQALQKVASGKADATITDLPLATYLINENGLSNLTVLSSDELNTTSDGKEVCIGTRKDLRELSTIIDKAAKLINQNEINKIKEKWLIHFVNESNNPINLSEKEKQWLKEHPVIVCGNNLLFPPYDFYENDQPTGFSIDYLQLLAQKVGLKLKYYTDYWPVIYPKAIDKEIDIIASMRKTKEREKNFIFSTPTLDADIPILITNSNNNSIKTIDDLTGKKIGVLKDTFQDYYFKEFYPEINVITYDSSFKLMNAFTDNEYDATILDLGVARYSSEKYKIPIKIVEKSDNWRVPADQSLHFGIRKDWPELHSILEKAKLAVTDAELKKLHDKWEHYISFNHKQLNLLNEDMLNLSQKIPLSVKEQEWLNKHKVIKITGKETWLPLQNFNPENKETGIWTESNQFVFDLPLIER